jgi:hypothetical protein
MKSDTAARAGRAELIDGPQVDVRRTERNP